MYATHDSANSLRLSVSRHNGAVITARAVQCWSRHSNGQLGVDLRGKTDLELQVHEDTIVTAAPSLDIRTHYALGDATSFGLVASGMTPLRSDVIRIDDREVGRYGRLLLTVGAGLQAALR
jgi:hypothetical protein